MTKRSATSLMGKSLKPSARNTMGKLQPETKTVGRLKDSTPARTAALEGVAPNRSVAISPDKQDISITVNVTEGERYVVSGVKLEGNYLDREDEFKSLVTIRPGEPYNADQVTETTKAFSEYFARFGFAFARVEAVPEIDRENN
eukprot:gene3179-4504_t